MVEILVITQKVRLCLAELAKSPDPWINEEAKLALAEADRVGPVSDAVHR